jgi:hypothetical protein
MSYENDFVLWADEQAGLLRRRASGEMVNDGFDWEHLAEEIEGVARNDRHEVASRLAIVCQHLLKIVHQPEKQTDSNSWASTVIEQRARLELLIEDSPSLVPYAATRLARAYSVGRRMAGRETGIGTLPVQCPWTIDQVLDPDFWPEQFSEPPRP